MKDVKYESSLFFEICDRSKVASHNRFRRIGQRLK
jgi:hypothetical protein